MSLKYRLIILTVMLVAVFSVCGCRNDKKAGKSPESRSAANAETSSTLADAVNNDKPQALKNVLKSGANPDVVMLDGTTILHAAVGMGRVECVRVLLEHGANVHIADKKGQTPLHKATCYTADPEIVRALLQAGAKPGIKDKAGKTPLDYAVENKTRCADGSPAKDCAEKCVEILEAADKK